MENAGQRCTKRRLAVPSNPLTGAVPLNLRKPGGEETVVKSTSYRPGESHRVPVTRSQYDDPRLQQRNVGCTPLRRYPNGKLDVKYVAQQIVDLVHKAKDGGKLTEFEKALLTSILPAQFHYPGMDVRMTRTMARMSDEERLLVAILLQGHLKEEENFNAGRGGGSVSGRSTSRS